MLVEPGIRAIILETIDGVVRAKVQALPDVMTPAEACEYLRLSRASLANMRTKGIGPKFVRAGKLLRYRREDLLAWLGEPQAPGALPPSKPGVGNGA